MSAQCQTYVTRGVNTVVDLLQERSFDLVKEWLEFVKEHEPAVLLLVCNAFPSDENTTVGLSRQAVLQLCIEHSFELVELNAKPETEDGFMEKVGVARISEAVQTNTWPSMRKRGSCWFTIFYLKF